MITPRVMLITPSYSNGYYVLSFLGHDYQVAIRNEVAETVLYCGCVSNPIGTLIRVSASESTAELLSSLSIQRNLATREQYEYAFIQGSLLVLSVSSSTNYPRGHHRLQVLVLPETGIRQKWTGRPRRSARRFSRYLVRRVMPSASARRKRASGFSLPGA